MATPRTAAIVLAAANASAVCNPQVAAAGPLALNGAAVSGGVAALDAARRILITTAANETGKTLVITGLDRERNPIQETVALPNAGSVYTIQDFLQVTAAVISAPAAGNISVGTNGVASTKWLRFDTNVPFSAASVGVNLGGVAATVTVEVTLDQIDKSIVDRLAGGGYENEAASGLPGAYVPPSAFAANGGSGLVADTLVMITTPVFAVRLTVNAGAQTAGVRLTMLQQGVRA